MAYSARSLSVNLLQNPVKKVGHGYTVGKVLSYNSGAYNLSIADSLVHCQGTVIVSYVLDADTFYTTQEGWLNNLTGLVASTQYYVSPTSAGTLTATMPTASGQVVLPCLVTDSTTSGYFYGGSGTQIESGQIFQWTTVNTNVANTGVNRGYFTSSGGAINLTLPPDGSVAVGDVIRVSNLSGNFAILTNASQKINFGNVVAATSITSTAVGDSIELVCYASAPHALFNTLSLIGNLTPV